MVSLPDGLDSSSDRSDSGKLWESILHVMPRELKALIERINGLESEKISCLIADGIMGWALEVAAKMGIKKAAFWPSAAALMALLFNIPSIIDDVIIDSDGWTTLENSGNSTFANDACHENKGFQLDLCCLAWLDQQPQNSVIYVAFGSFTVFDHNQFQELALGLELINRPFSWVVRQNITEDVHNAYPTGFEERVHGWGHVVSWAPQQKVLSHPSVACFISHCGWNSTIEGISNGVPFLCWPYFTDQIFNTTYICDYLKIGLELNKDDNGIIRREEIKDKLERVLGEEGFKERVLDLQAKILDSVREGGSSDQNLHDFLASQGHVIPLMELALNLVKHGYKVTFVNTEFMHERVIKALPETENVRELVQMVSLPDGLDSSSDRSDSGKLWESILHVMPRELKALIERINGLESEKISCLIADGIMGWALEVVAKMGIKKAAFWPSAAALMALLFNIPSIIDDGIIDSDGWYSSKHTY
ncbi:unnamed protein product [Fraxinus pennsylvanica]|uniref:Uncharacterized protein n=1 Tax=Fraxinus pennsylvanica TaxID=56036 RepID=A0AAD2E4X9_9LAMI|nr:unnamed protein product [Fraxinus pennsylvanica]